MKYLKRLTNIVIGLVAGCCACFVVGIGIGFAYQGFKWAQLILVAFYGF